MIFLFYITKSFAQNFFKIRRFNNIIYNDMINQKDNSINFFNIPTLRLNFCPLGQRFHDTLESSLLVGRPMFVAFVSNPCAHIYILKNVYIRYITLPMKFPRKQENVGYQPNYPHPTNEMFPQQLKFDRQFHQFSSSENVFISLI